MTIFRISDRTIKIENVVYAQVFPEVTLLYPAAYHVIRVTGEEAKQAHELLKAAGFVGKDILLNPRRFVAAQNGGAVSTVFMFGWEKALIVPSEVIAQLEAAEAPIEAVEKPAVETPAVEKPASKKKTLAPGVGA